MLSADANQDKTIRVVPVPANSLAAWIEAEEFVKKAIWRTTHWDITHVLHQFIDGKVQLSMMYEGNLLMGAIISEVIVYPLKRVFFVHGLAANPSRNMEGFDDVWNQICGLAKSCGCQTVSASGRMGWLRQVPGAKSLNMWEVDI